MIKDVFVFMMMILFLCGFSFYSYTGYQTAQELSPQSIGKELQRVQEQSPLLDVAGVEELANDIETSRFSAVSQRNAFVRYKPVVKKAKKKPVTITLPKPKFVPLAVEPEPEPLPEEVFYFRGQVILGDKVSYAIERESDRKTFFLNKGDKTRDFIVLDTNEKQVVITDYNENIKILKKAS